MGDILAKDMKWPHCRASIVPSNTWNTQLSKLMTALDEVANERWWICDPDLKYLNIRIDTRDNAFILSIDSRKEGGPKERIDPQRVVDAIDRYKSRYPPRCAPA